jgi:hypothetical protein
MKRRTVSLTDETLNTLDRIAKQNRTTVSGVVEAAATVLDQGGTAAQALLDSLVPDRRGGARSRRSPDDPHLSAASGQDAE